MHTDVRWKAFCSHYNENECAQIAEHRLQFHNYFNELHRNLCKFPLSLKPRLQHTRLPDRSPSRPLSHTRETVMGLGVAPTQRLYVITHHTPHTERATTRRNALYSTTLFVVSVCVSILQDLFTRNPMCFVFVCL